MRVVAIVPELMTAARLESIVSTAGGSFTRLDAPGALPPAAEVDLLLVDWGSRDPSWAAELTEWRGAFEAGHGPRIVLFGPHTDLDAHATARASGLGPMLARSALFGSLASLLDEVQA